MNFVLIWTSLWIELDRGRPLLQLYGCLRKISEEMLVIAGFCSEKIELNILIFSVSNLSLGDHLQYCLQDAMQVLAGNQKSYFLIQFLEDMRQLSTSGGGG
jgi:hypothetical protein